MASYLALRIIENGYTYDFVVSKRPDLKSGIDAYLLENGYDNLIVK